MQLAMAIFLIVVSSLAQVSFCIHCCHTGSSRPATAAAWSP
jgi:hypothetical protein